jgi:hypothetical protein
MRLLSALAELGIFVREYPTLPVLELWSESADCDMAIVSAGNDPVHVAAARQLSQRVTPVLVVMVEHNVPAELFADARPVAVISDTDRHEDVVTALARAGQEARVLQHSANMQGVVVLGQVRYLVNVGFLEGRGKSLGLSPTERGILGRLLESPGVPVALDELERHLRPRSAGAGNELRAAITRLRRKLQELGGNPWSVGTVRGFGYVLVP